jgi:hypothetical protein
MSTDTHHTAPTKFVEAAGVRFAYRRFGKRGEVPIVLNTHFTGAMDHWDPAVTDGLANSRNEVSAMQCTAWLQIEGGRP